jgi:hypothetical protein
MPKWVTGGEFGDLSNIMNQRDKSYEDVAQSEQQTESNRYGLDKLERQDEYRRRVAEVLGGETAPKDLRGMYEAMSAAAGETGNPEEIVKLREELDKLDLQKRKDVIGAIDIAEKGPYNILKSVYGDKVPLTEEEANAIYNRRNKEKAKKEDTVKMFNMIDQTVEDVPISLAIQKQRDRSHIRLDDPRMRDGTIELPAFNLAPSAGPQGASGGSDADPSGVLAQVRNALTPYAQKGDRFPGQTKAQGDTSRLTQPSVGDQVKDIKLNRSAKGAKTLKG